MFRFLLDTYCVKIRPAFFMRLLKLLNEMYVSHVIDIMEVELL